MTRAIRFAVIPGLTLAFCTFALPALGQNYQPNPGTSPGINPGQGASPQQPARASVYGPPVGSVAPARPGTTTAQPANGQVGSPQQQLPVQQAGGQQPIQQPIRQPGVGAAQPGAAGPNAGGPGGIQVPNGLNVPRAAIVPAAPLQPEWYPLDPKVQEWVDQVLVFWEQRSDQVKTLECTFQKWEYDPQYIPNIVQQLQVQGQLHKMPFTKYATGVIKYAAPDKGLFRVEQLQQINVANGAQKYDTQPKENGENWITDGKRVFAFDAIRKEVLESQLPPEMQGKSLADGPLPFMFGAKAESIKARYWIRPLQAEAKGEYCLEAVPRGRQDAANFKSVQIVLDEKLYLPTKMQIFESDFTPANPHRTAYKFDKHDVNATKLQALADPLKLWHRDFFEVKVPSGWRRVVRDANGNIIGPGNTAAGPAPGPQPAQAIRPGPVGGPVQK